jgi:transposase, IS5 family
VERAWLKRRQAIEPVIGHAKADHGMLRCWLKGSTGDALHAVLCAAGFNIRWLMRAIVRLGLKGLLLRLFGLAAGTASAIAAMASGCARPLTLTADVGAVRGQAARG